MASRLHERQHMVQSQLAERGILDPLVLRAMESVPREMFVPQELADSAYVDGPLPIGEKQTISQPYIVALMVEALQLEGGEHVLEVGAGSGYAAAVLAEIAGDVIAVERISRLVQIARQNLEVAGCTTVSVVCDDGSQGWPTAAPFDAILVSAGAPKMPEVLKHQLKVGGRLVLPVGAKRTEQRLVRVTRTGRDTFKTEDLGAVQFVPLIGEAGWAAGD